MIFFNGEIEMPKIEKIKFMTEGREYTLRGLTISQIVLEGDEGEERIVKLIYGYESIEPEYPTLYPWT